MIPEAGRDVQCSNCGDTWFQHHPDHPAMDDVDSDVLQDISYDDPAEDEDQDADQDADDTTQNAAPRRRLDPEVTNVLREEAERETRARADDASSLESQPELGLEDGNAESDKRSREARARMARMRGQPEDAQPAADVDPSSRRGLLPDIEEINSSLRNEDGGAIDIGGESEYPEAVPREGNVGFRRGFLFVVLISVALLLLYMYAPQISRAIPALSMVLSEYVDVVNDARVWLDDQMGALMRWLDGMASSAPTDSAVEGNDT